MLDEEGRRKVSSIPLGTRWLLKSGEDELPFLVVTVSEPRYEVGCETINRGKPPVRFRIHGTDWLDYLMDGSIVFQG